MILRRYALTCLAALLLAASALAQEPHPPFEDFHQATEAILALPVRAPAADFSARQLEVAAHCNPEKARLSIVSLSWEPASSPSLISQRLDISKFQDGFRRGAFLATAELPKTQKAVGVDGPEPGVNYYWRVVSKTRDGGMTSEIGRFDVPVCPWDEPDQGEKGPSPRP